MHIELLPPNSQRDRDTIDEDIDFAAKLIPFNGPNSRLKLIIADIKRRPRIIRARFTNEDGELIGHGINMLPLVGTTDCELAAIATHPDYRGKQVGTQVVQALLTHAQEFGYIRSSFVSETNALPFYEKLGFQEVDLKQPLNHPFVTGDMEEVLGSCARLLDQSSALQTANS